MLFPWGSIWLFVSRSGLDWMAQPPTGYQAPQILIFRLACRGLKIRRASGFCGRTVVSPQRSHRSQKGHKFCARSRIFRHGATSGQKCEKVDL